MKKRCELSAGEMDGLYDWINRKLDRLGIESQPEVATKLLLERSIAVVTGSADGESTARLNRVSIGGESEERIWEALQVIQAQTRIRDFDREALRKKVDARTALLRGGR